MQGSSAFSGGNHVFGNALIKAVVLIRAILFSVSLQKKFKFIFKQLPKLTSILKEMKCILEAE